MNAQTFVSAVKSVVVSAAVADSIKLCSLGPPGRQPSPVSTELAAWFQDLSARDRAMVERVAREAAYAATFGFLCVLDGVRAVEGAGPKGDFELWFTKDGQRERLNPDHGEMLHDLFNAI